MTRHWLTVSLSVVACCGFLPSGQADERPRPNILHIHTDDWRADAIRALGAAELQTPNLDALIARGMTFTRAYTQGSMIGAVCTPSRTMLLTGRSWQRIPGAAAAGNNAADPATFLPSVLEAAGYQTWHNGKPGNSFAAGIREFQTRITDAAEGDLRVTCSQRMADRTIEFLTSRIAANETRPFYIYLAPTVPHDPRLAEPRFHELYNPDQMPLPPAFLPVHPFNNGEMTVRDEKLAPWPRTEADTRRQTADYFACLTGLDHHVGRILQTLDEAGLTRHTLVIFSSDNGLSLGDHGLFGKQNLYEFGGMHVPLVIAGPDIATGRSDALVYLMDLFPTLVEFAGAELPEGVDGKSLRPILEGREAQVRKVLYTGYRDCMRSIRDDRWKLIRYPLINKTQLFDLATDHHEQSDLAGLPEYAAHESRLLHQLQEQMALYDDRHPLTIDNPQSPEWVPPAQ
jgi:arylsulfatase A-like enzyme